MYAVTSEGSSQGEKEERPPELPLLSEQLSLDELWDMLGECLKELEESHDQHAVLGELCSPPPAPASALKPPLPTHLLPSSSVSLSGENWKPSGFLL